MNDQETIKTLNTLMHLDRETARLYSEAIPTIGESDVGVELQGYRRDHARHADECFDAMRKLGAEPQPAIPELEDFVRMEEDAVANAGKQDTTLMALFMAEEAVNLQYAEAAQDDFPGGVKQVVQQHLQEDKNHLQSIRDSLQIAATSATGVRFGV